MEWPAPLATRDPGALESARAALADEIDAVAFAQFLFFRQWFALKSRAAALGIRLFGDLPLFLAHDLLLMLGLGLKSSNYWLVLIVVSTSLISVYGDLMESLLKRERGVKDSGTILPGG